MKQREDWDSYSSTNPKRRMTLISIREATRQQTREPKNCRKKRRRRSAQDQRRQRRRFKIYFYFLLSYFILLARCL
jgi:hypothetical protein